MTYRKCQINRVLITSFNGKIFNNNFQNNRQMALLFINGTTLISRIIHFINKSTLFTYTCRWCLTLDDDAEMNYFIFVVFWNVPIKMTVNFNKRYVCSLKCEFNTKNRWITGISLTERLYFKTGDNMLVAFSLAHFHIPSTHNHTTWSKLIELT